RPTVAVLTGIAPVHLEQLGSLWAILEAKLELFEHMDPAGWWVYPAPDAFIRAGIAALPLEQHKTLRFVPGIQMVDPGDPDLLAGERFRWDPVGQRWHFTLHLREKRAETNLATVAMGQIWSALAASAGALALGLTLEQVAHRLPLTPPITGRMELQGRFPNRTILVDCYNSNPVSAGDALETLVRIGQGRPTVAVLGGMKELGPEAERYHRELGGKVRALNIGTLLAVGEEAPWIAAGAAGGLTQVFTAAAITDAEGWLGTQIPGDAVVLLKGSRTYALERALDLSW
ncbi:MAG TPA: Mur ligase family protein, partial [bacterium]|nr:Mur ligase family protein [bacterium]